MDALSQLMSFEFMSEGPTLQHKSRQVPHSEVRGCRLSTATGSTGVRAYGFAQLLTDSM